MEEMTETEGWKLYQKMVDAMYEKKTNQELSIVDNKPMTN